MTKNQIEYVKYLEGKRANEAQEALTFSRDEAAKQARLIELRELGRHNAAVEGETARHNVAGEQLQSQSLEETRRHGMALEQLTQQQINESVRANTAREKQNALSLEEQKRHSLITELQADKQLDLRGQELAESKRHSLAQESIGRTQASAALQQAAASQEQARVAASRALIAQQEANTRSRQVSQDYAYKQAQLDILERQVATQEVKNMISMYEARTGATLRQSELEEEIFHNRATERQNSGKLGKDIASSISTLVPTILSLY